MNPYQAARACASITLSDGTASDVCDGFPYLPSLTVNRTSSPAEVKRAIVNVLLKMTECAYTANHLHASDPDFTQISPIIVFGDAPLGEGVPLLPKYIHDPANWTMKRIAGGNTNDLYLLTLVPLEVDDNPSPTVGHLPPSPDSPQHPYYGPGAIVRLFGAPTLIDRDTECPLFGSLSAAGVGPLYYGRFGGGETAVQSRSGVSGGRVEAFLRGYRPLSPSDLHDEDVSDAIAEQAARVHRLEIPSNLRHVHVPGEAGLFKTLRSWLESVKKGLRDGDPESEKPYGRVPLSRFPEVQAIDLTAIESIVDWVEAKTSASKGLPPVAAGCPPPFDVLFCHNDLIAANIMLREVPQPSYGEKPDIQLIDFEYGGVNFVSFDIANHFNEFAGGTDDANPRYDRFPTVEERRRFIGKYAEARGFGEDAVELLMEEVDIFLVINHFFWGSWAIYQAANEGLEGTFDYLQYGSRRISEGLFHWNRRTDTDQCVVATPPPRSAQDER